jgi:acetyl esterase/lipase
MIHGGCWSNSFGLDHLGPASTALASAGFAVWAPEYRRVGDPGGGWPGSLEDILSALHALAGLRNSRLNMARVAIAGHSAGGHLALLAGANPPAPLNAAAVIGLAAITDTAAYARGDNSCERNTVAFMGSEPGARPDQWRAANPVSAATPANTLLLNGTADALVTPPQGRMNGARTITVEGAGHFDFIHPGTAAWKTFMELLEAEL